LEIDVFKLRYDKLINPEYDPKFYYGVGTKNLMNLVVSLSGDEFEVLSTFVENKHPLSFFG
jgi:hypothetical protein